MRVARVMMGAVGSWLLFVVLVDGYYKSLDEVAGKALADHAVKFCPNWLLGMATGAFAVGLLWWCVGRRRSE